MKAVTRLVACGQDSEAHVISVSLYMYGRYFTAAPQGTNALTGASYSWQLLTSGAARSDRVSSVTQAKMYTHSATKLKACQQGRRILETSQGMPSHIVCNSGTSVFSEQVPPSKAGAWAASCNVSSCKVQCCQALRPAFQRPPAPKK